MTLIEFSDLLGKQIVIRNRPNFHDPAGKWYAEFDCGEMTDGMFLKGEHGDAATIEGAMRDYARAISGQRIVFNAGSDRYRQEYNVPQLDF
jgi:hypothetical protein